MNKLTDFYRLRVSLFEQKRKNISRKMVVLSFGRLIAFILFITLPFVIEGESRVLKIVLSMLFLSIFLYLVKKHIALGRDKALNKNLMEINQKESKAIGHDFSAFDPGNEFTDYDHINSFDLDLFGKGSLFQYLNRSVTFKGKELLAGFLQSPFKTPEKIYNRQKLIGEMANMPDWRQLFMANGMLYTEDRTESELFNRWGNEEFSLKTIKILPVLMVLLPLLSVASVVYWIFTGNFSYFLLSGVVQFCLWMIEKKNTTTIYRQFGNRVKVLKKYAVLFKLIESVKWKSEEAKQIMEQLQKSGLPAEKIKHLGNIVAAYDNRNNLLIGMLGNMMFLWDIFFSYRLIKWHRQNKASYETWSNTYALFDALVSLGNYAFNEPKFCFPKFIGGDFQLKAEQIGHPLINPKKRIVNDFELSGSRKLIVITGANMAGKSTFLRTVGVNIILGQCGAPVCATEMVFAPVKVYTNMRTTDSLFDDESYFFAELKRIKFILDELEKGIPMLIILDEMLKGTNSVDKLAGSRKLLKKLVEKKAPAIVATHDLKLTGMAKDYPYGIQNKCFEINIENDEMHFDYRLQDGVTQTMNATFMMKKMGIIDNEAR
ncbi:MAG: hypothetical protein K9H26_13715 [Prolixibacteraceae bacterium]|nr:hypothetical protein [Prolixibacteraceae bacterium]